MSCHFTTEKARRNGLIRSFPLYIEDKMKKMKNNHSLLTIVYRADVT